MVSAVCAMCLLLSAGMDLAISAESDDVRMEEAVYVEVTLADPQRAIRLYRELLHDGSASPRVRAEAGLRLANCYRLLGDDPKARGELARVIEDFPREEDLVELARRYLGERVSPDPSRFMPPDVLAYFELVDPARQLRGAQDLLEGTPFQNPIDYYVSFLAGQDENVDRTGDSTRRDVSPVAAFLNEGFLSEVQKIEGLAACVPYPRESNRDFLLAFLPGSSDILRGLVQMLLTISDARGCGHVDGIPLLRFPPQREEPSPRPEDHWPHVALGESFVVFGSPRRLVEQAVRRYQNEGPSLAEEPDFRSAQASRAGSVLFSYIHGGRTLEALGASLPASQRRVFQTTRELLHLDDLHAVAFTVSHSPIGDALRLTVRARVHDGSVDALEGFRTQPLDPAALDRVPVGCQGFVALRLAAAGQAETLLSCLQRVLVDPRQSSAATGLQALLQRPETRELLESLDLIVAGSGARTIAPAALGGFLLLGFRRDEGTETLESFLGEALFLAFRTPESREFSDDTLTVDGREIAIRYAEPVSGLRLLCLWSGDTATVSFAPANLWTSARLASRPSPGRFADLPPRARKVLFLCPKALTEGDVGGESVPPALRVVLASVGRAFVVTREGRDSLALELVIPDLTETTKTALQALAEQR